MTAPRIARMATSVPRTEAMVVAPLGSVAASELALSSVTAAIAAAAPPPMPLYMAIICGMSVMATLRPLYQA